jgi:uncharacterized protein YjbJ (UPF0337 family)
MFENRLEHQGRGMWEKRRKPTTEETGMGATDKAKDKAQVAKGHVKEAAGRATGDKSLEAEGAGDKAAGNLKQAGEKLKDAARGLKK